jgi:MFS family permease
MIQIVAQVTRLEDRPRLFGMFGAVFGLSSIIGPLIGGGFTDHVSFLFLRLFLLC